MQSLLPIEKPYQYRIEKDKLFIEFPGLLEIIFVLDIKQSGYQKMQLLLYDFKITAIQDKYLVYGREHEYIFKKEKEIRAKRKIRELKAKEVESLNGRLVQEGCGINEVIRVLLN